MTLPDSRILLLLALIVTAVCYYLWVGVKAFKIESDDFRPTPYRAGTPGADALDKLLAITTPLEWSLGQNVQQRAYIRTSTNGTSIVYLHGSPGNGAGFHEIVEQMANLGFGALVIDLPGYGASDGARRWGDDYLRSIRAGLDRVLQESPAERIVLLGYSQGACVAARSASIDERVDAVILLAGYTKLSDQLHHQFRWRLPGIGLFAITAAQLAGVDVQRMDCVAALQSMGTRPVLVISGMDDHAIPVAMAETLANTPENGELWLIPGAGHGDLIQQSGLHIRLAEFSVSSSFLSDTTETTPFGAPELNQSRISTHARH